VTEALTVEGIDAFYGASHILHDVSLTVQPGEVVLLLGRNGAGKTTIMRTVMGLMTKVTGRARYGSSDILGLPPHRIARLGIGFVPEDRRMFARLTVGENLALGRKRAPDGHAGVWDLQRIFDLFPDLAAIQDRRAGTLSGGQQQMVAIARTLMGNARLLLLDEPAEGLAPILVGTLAARLKQLRDEGLSMMISEQNLTFARALADRAYVIEGGGVRHYGTIAELALHPDAWAHYIAF
jgi:branched-chain amino acid transport system ATP-binding protein